MASIDDLLAILARRVTAFGRSIFRIARAVIRRDDQEREAAVEDLGEQLGATGTLVDLAGRESVLRDLRRKGIDAEELAPIVSKPPPPPPRPPGTAAGGLPEDVISPVVPNVPFREAIADVVSREPTLARDVESVAAAYRRRGFALARSTDLKVTKHVQGIIERTLATGLDRDAAVAEIEQASEDFSRAYAETVYRNNVTRAFAEGMHAKAMDPALRRVIAAFLLENPKDFDTTAICRACVGTVAPPEHPIWNIRTPPLHHGCRSGLRVLTIVDAEAMGLVDEEGRIRVRIPNPSVSAAPGFGGRG